MTAGVASDLAARRQVLSDKGAKIHFGRLERMDPREVTTLMTAENPWADVERVVSSVDEFLEVVAEISQPSIEHSVSSDARWAWRGAANAGWGLHSSLSRKFGNPGEVGLVQFESALQREARDWSLDWHPAGGRLGYLELLARLQHHGVPTRFIDFSTDPLVALWFAVSEQQQAAADGRVFVADVDGKWIHGSPPTPEPNWDLLRQSWAAESGIDVSDTLHWMQSIYAWRPPPLDDRIVRQKSCFIFGGVPFRHLDHVSLSLQFPLPGPPIGVTLAPAFTYRIPTATKRSIEADLYNRFGLSASILFPDPEGLARYSLTLAGGVEPGLGRAGLVP